MIAWPWLIPTFMFGGMFGFVVFCILSVGSDE